jgi:regulator of protease activity HflC (stomatin/prohibitin superfamily)
VVSHESLKERVLDIPPQQCITRDNVGIEVDAVVYWQLLEHAALTTPSTTCRRPW